MHLHRGMKNFKMKFVEYVPSIFKLLSFPSKFFQQLKFQVTRISSATKQ